MKRCWIVLMFLVVGTTLAFGVERGGVLKIGFRQDVGIGGFDPHRAEAFSSQRMAELIYENLVDFDSDMHIVPVLATSWEVSADGLRYVFHIRQGVKFHNGIELTAEDVKASYERMLDPQFSVWSSQLQLIENIEIIDKYTVAFMLKSPSAAFLSSIAGNAKGILPKDAIENGHDFKREPIGTGPFRLKAWTPGVQIILERNPLYWDKELPYLDGIEVYIMPDPAAQKAALLKGEIDFVPEATAELAHTLSSVKGIKILTAPDLNYALWGINHAVPPFDNVNVRRAMSLAINRQEVIDVAYFGMASIGTILPPSLTEWWVPPTELPYYEYDVQKAKELLKEAGYPQGFSCTLTVAADLPEAVEFSKIVQAQLAEVGIRVDIKLVDWGTFLEAWHHSNFELFASINGGFPDPHTMLFPHLSSNGVWNVFNYKDTALDALLEAGLREMDHEKRVEIYKQAQKRIADQMPILILAYADIPYVMNARVEGFAPISTRSWRNLRTTWLAKVGS